MDQSSKKPAPKETGTNKAVNMIRDYSKEPFFIKKDEEADAFLKKHGFPEELLKIKRGYLQ